MQSMETEGPFPLAAGERPFVRCPVCGRRAEPTLFAQHPALDPAVLDVLVARHPGWRPAEGICPACVQEAVDALADGGQDLHRLLGHLGARGDDPLVAAAGQPALPVPLRLHANPNFRGQGVVLGMLDSGFYPHPDLTKPLNRIRLTVDIMRDPPLEGAVFSTPEARSWHGLMTSAVAAGNGYLSRGRYRGIASEATLVLARVGQPTMRIPDADIVRGLRWMQANHARLGIRVLNVSLGGDEETDTATDPIDLLAEALTVEGVLVVAAAGNTGKRCILPPASAPSALTVGGATDQNLLNVRLHTFLPWRSSFGPTRAGDQKPEIVAPSMLLAAPLLPGTVQAREAAQIAALIGLDDDALPAARADARRALYLRSGALARLDAAQIRRLLVDRLHRHNWLSGSYQFVDGTSVAAPIVSAIAVQMVEANPTLTPALLKALLTATAVPMENVPVTMQGHGVVNPAGAVAAALRAPGGALAGCPTSPQVVPGQGITFYYYNPQAVRVALVGDFNGWFAAGAEFMRIEAGVFRATLPPLPSGAYHYKFLLDNRTAVDDPENLDKTPDGYGGFSTILRVPA